MATKKKRKRSTATIGPAKGVNLARLKVRQAAQKIKQFSKRAPAAVGEAVLSATKKRRKKK